jgi:hypothetical protein
MSKLGTALPVELGKDTHGAALKIDLLNCTKCDMHQQSCTELVSKSDGQTTTCSNVLRRLVPQSTSRMLTGIKNIFL